LDVLISKFALDIRKQFVQRMSQLTGLRICLSLLISYDLTAG
jgi:hypothetical protein